MLGHELRAHSSRAVHERPHGPRVRFFGKNESSTSISQPFGALAPTLAGRINRQQLSPLLMGLGVQGGKKAQRFQRRLESGQLKGPLADAIRQIQQFAPGVIGGAQDIGERVSREGGEAVGRLQEAIRGAQAALPTYQAAADRGLAGTERALAGSEDIYNRARALLPGLEAASARGLAGLESAQSGAAGALRQAQANMPALQAAMARGVSGADEALNLARGYTTGSAVTGAQTALDLAKRYAERAASPIADEDLYQQATRRVLQQVRPGLAARGLEGGGAGAQMETDALRNMTFDFAQRRAAEQQATMQGLQGAAGGLSNIQQAGLAGLGGAVTGLGEAAGRSAALPASLVPLTQALTQSSAGTQAGARSSAELGQSLLPYLSGITNAAGGVGNAATGAQQMSMQGANLGGMDVAAVNQLGQVLMQQYGLPMQAAQQMVGLLTGGVQPSTQLVGATGPIATPSSKGFRII